jgi:hypothetical protein
MTTLGGRRESNGKTYELMPFKALRAKHVAEGNNIADYISKMVERYPRLATYFLVYYYLYKLY